uniref:Uncharacterized protein n=1 Tax=Rhizophora mucronata TaxID=61149 RepID=A0A2P2K5W1_RHIMU
MIISDLNAHNTDYFLWMIVHVNDGFYWID